MAGVTASANAAGSWAIIASCPSVMPIPCTATAVATQGTPWARLLTTLPLMPAPQRSGATVIRQPRISAPRRQRRHPPRHPATAFVARARAAYNLLLHPCANAGLC